MVNSALVLDSKGGGVLEKKRVIWLDVARFMAIIMVVYYHCGVEPEIKEWLLLPFHAACTEFFFLWAGYFVCRKVVPHGLDWGRFIFLIRPYFLWAILYAICFCGGEFLEAYHAGGVQNVGSFVLHRVLGIGGIPCNTPLWFLRDLAILSLLAPLFKRASLGIQLFVTFFLLCVPSYEIEPEWWNMRYLSSNYASVFCLGMLLSVWSLEKIKKVLLGAPWGILGASLAVSVLEVLFSCGHGRLTALLSVWALSAFGVLIERYYPKFAGIVASVAPCIFLIFSSHVFFLALMNAVLIQFDVFVLPDVIWLCVLAPLSMAFPILLLRMLRKYFPQSIPYVAASK